MHFASFKNIRVYQELSSVYFYFKMNFIGYENLFYFLDFMYSI